MSDTCRENVLCDKKQRIVEIIRSHEADSASPQNFLPIPLFGLRTELILNGQFTASNKRTFIIFANGLTDAYDALLGEDILHVEFSQLN